MAPEKKRLEYTHYARTIVQRSVDFTCQECGAFVTELRYPGPAPSYCLDCVEAVRRRQARERKRRQRGR